MASVNKVILIGNLGKDPETRYMQNGEKQESQFSKLASIGDIVKRFNEKISISKHTGCHEWIGAKQSNGYGRFRAFGRSFYAHRFSALINYGIIQSHLDVCHECDNRSCVNPEHLFIGTRKDNMQNAVKKGRQARGYLLSIKKRGDKSPLAKLTKADVIEIREKHLGGLKTSDIAMLFNTSADNVRRIVRFDTWKGA